MNKARRHVTPQEKVAALKRHLLEGAPVSDLCDELGIAPNRFYRWQRELFENVHTVLDSGRKSKAVEDAKDRKIELLEAKLQRKNEVLSELMEEHTQLKKDLGELALRHGCREIGRILARSDLRLYSSPFESVSSSWVAGSSDT